MVKQVNVLGTIYKITMKKYSDDPMFKDMTVAGYCNMHEKQIVICDPKSWPTQETITKEFFNLSIKETCRHEITHAFLYESGLDSNSSTTVAWATNEEFVDWLAIQSPKIFKCFEEAGLL